MRTTALDSHSTAYSGSLFGCLTCYSTVHKWWIFPLNPKLIAPTVPHFSSVVEAMIAIDIEWPVDWRFHGGRMFLCFVLFVCLGIVPGIEKSLKYLLNVCPTSFPSPLPQVTNLKEDMKIPGIPGQRVPTSYRMSSNTPDTCISERSKTAQIYCWNFPSKGGKDSLPGGLRMKPKFISCKHKISLKSHILSFKFMHISLFIPMFVLTWK